MENLGDLRMGFICSTGRVQQNPADYADDPIFESKTTGGRSAGCDEEARCAHPCRTAS